MALDLYFLTHLWAFWIILLLVFLLAEGFSQSFITVWLALGSLLGLLAERMLLSFTWQMIFFTFSSILCIIFLRPFCIRVLHSKTEATNVEALIGQKALALTDIGSFETGQAKIAGQVWTALSVEGFQLVRGSYGIICEIRGVKLILEPVPESVPVPKPLEASKVEQH